MKDNIPSFLLRSGEALPAVENRRLRASLVDGALARLGEVMRTTFVQWDLASRKGLLQSVDGRVKLICLFFLIVVASLSREITSQLALAGLLALLAVLSRLALGSLYRRILTLAFFFGFLVVFPAAFNGITEGTVVLPLVTLPRSYTFWIYTIPQTVGLTREGLLAVGLVSLRMANSLCACFLLLYSTPLSEIVRSLKVFRVPDMVLVLLFLAYKYIFVFSTVLEEVYMAGKSRLSGPLDNRGMGNWTAGRMAFLLRKTTLKCDQIFNAMISRGVGKEIAIAHSRPLRPSDYAMGLVLLCLGAFILVL